MEGRSYHPLPDDNADFEVARSFRETRPAHYTLKIKSFSLLSQILQDVGVQNYESDIFDAGGFKWKLSLYPLGDKERNGEGYISLYLVIAETNSLPLGWEVNVDFKLFVFDQIRDQYMTIQGTNGKVRRFHRMKTEWGFSQLVPLSSFNDVANGYLIQDMCVFGAEVSVVNDTGRGECLTLLKGVGTTHTWKIDNFSSLGDKIHYSEVFTIDGRKWKLGLNPKGNSEAKDKYISLFLELQDVIPPERQTYAKRTLRIVNQNCGQHVEFPCNVKFPLQTILDLHQFFFPFKHKISRVSLQPEVCDDKKPTSRGFNLFLEIMIKKSFLFTYNLGNPKTIA